MSSETPGKAYISADVLRDLGERHKWPGGEPYEYHQWNATQRAIDYKGESLNFLRIADRAPLLAITGGPGVGKTTLLLNFLALYHAQYPNRRNYHVSADRSISMIKKGAGLPEHEPLPAEFWPAMIRRHIGAVEDAIGDSAADNGLVTVDSGPFAELYQFLAGIPGAVIAMQIPPGSQRTQRAIVTRELIGEGKSARGRGEHFPTYFRLFDSQGIDAIGYGPEESFRLASKQYEMLSQAGADRSAFNEDYVRLALAIQEHLDDQLFDEILAKMGKPENIRRTIAAFTRLYDEFTLRHQSAGYLETANEEAGRRTAETLSVIKPSGYFTKADRRRMVAETNFWTTYFGGTPGMRLGSGGIYGDYVSLGLPSENWTVFWTDNHPKNAKIVWNFHELAKSVIYG